MNYFLPEIIKTAATKFGGANYVYEKQNGTFVPHSFRQFYHDVKAIASTLQATHQPDDIIVICSENSYDYMVADAAIMGFVGISAVLSKEWNEYDLTNALALLRPKTFLYGTTKAKLVAKLSSKFPQIHFVPLAEILPCQTRSLDLRRMTIDTPCKIIFTSGTTSMPKAVMLTQRNMFACYDDLVRRAPMTHQDRDYLFLPLSHTYAGIWNFLISLINGMEIYLCSDTKQIFTELSVVQPTVFCAVPLIYERLYVTCQATGQDPLELLGGKIKYLFCGGAYFQPEIRKFLKSHGLNLLEAYGLTETSSMISVEYPNPSDFTSSGILMESLTAKVDQPNAEGIGELLIKGPNIFQAYYQNPDATNAVKTPDGYFRTGDLAKIIKPRPDGTDGEICYQTSDGVEYKIYLQGRKKRVILFSNGENIYPEDIEKLFVDENIAKVKIFQKGQQIFAQIFVKAPCSGQNYVDAVNCQLPKFSRIRDFEVIVDSFDTRLK